MSKLIGLLLAIAAVVALAMLWWFADAPPPAQWPGGAAAPAPAALPMASTASPTEPPANAQRANEPREDPPRASLGDAPQTSIVLLVQGTAGSPIAGARVQPLDDSMTGTVVTDAKGTCVLPIEPGEGSVHLLIEAELHFHRKAHLRRNPKISVKLRPITRLNGVVLDKETRAPVAGAELTFHHLGCEGCDRETTTTDASGRYDFAGYPLAGHVLHVHAEGYADQQFRTWIGGWTPRARRDLELERGLAVAGRVVDFTTGSPIPGVEVVAEGLSKDLATTDDAGVFGGHLLPGRNGSYRLSLRAEGYCRASSDWTAEELTAPQGLEIRLPRSVPFTGVVRNARGEPIPGAVIGRGQDHAFLAAANTRLDELLPTLRVGEERRLAGKRTQTDADGAFRTPGVPPWSRYWRVHASHSDYLAATLTIGEVGPPGSAVDLQFTLQPLGPTGVVAGRLMLNGAPLRGWVRWTGPTREGSGRVEREGRYRLQDVEVGHVELRATPNGYDRDLFGNAIRHTLNVAEDREHVHDFELSLEMTTISGRVSRADGTPIGKAPVNARSGTFFHNTNTKANGHYTLEVPAGAGPYRVGARTRASDEAIDGVAAGSTGVDFVLAASGVLRLRLVDRDTEEPVERFMCWRRSGVEQFEGRGAWTSKNGWHTFDLSIGTYELVVDATRDGYVRAQRFGVVIHPDATTNVTLEATTGATAVFSLADGQDPSAPPAHLLTTEEWSDVQLESDLHNRVGLPGVLLYSRQLTFGRNGRAEIKGLTPGRYRFKVFGADLAIEPEYVDVGPGRNEVIELRWREKK